MIFPSTISVSQNTILFSDFTEFDLDSGYKTSDFSLLAPLRISLNEKNNDGWKLFIQSTDFFSNNYGITQFDIEWKEAHKGVNEYKSLSIQKQLIANGNNSMNDYIQLNFRIKVDWLTRPGSYNVPFKIILEESTRFSNKKKQIRTWPN